MSKSRIVSLSATIATLIIGILVIIGWVMHNDFLRMIVAGQVKMKFNVAVCFVLSSIVLLIYLFNSNSKRYRSVIAFLSFVICMTGFLTLVEYIFSVNIGIDELFFIDEQRTSATYYAGRMSPLSAVFFILIGTGFFLFKKEKTAVYQFYYLSAIGFLSLLMLIGFNFISDIPTFIRLSIHVAIGFMLLAVAIWSAQQKLHKVISFERRLFTSFIVMLTLIAVISTFSFYYSNKRVSTSQLVDHTNQVLFEADNTQILTKNIEGGERGYIILYDSDYLKPFTAARNTIFQHINNLKELTKDNAQQQTRVDSLAIFVQHWIDFSVHCIRERNEKGFDAAMKLMKTGVGQSYIDKITTATTQIQEEEKRLLAIRKEENRKNIVSFNRAFAVFLTGVCVLLLFIVFSIRNNISTRKKAEEKVKALLEAAPDSMIIVNERNEITLVNQQTEIAFGYKREELIGKTVELLLPQGLKENSSFELYATRKNKSQFPVEITLAPLTTEEGKMISASVRDISTRKRAEEKFKGLLEAAPDAMIIANEKGYIILVNKQTERMFGYSREEMINKPVEILIPAEFRRSHVTHRTDYSKDPKTRSMGAGLELFAVRKDGTEFPVEISLSPLITDEGTLISASVRDITERKKADEQIAYMARIMEDSGDATFSTDASFVLKTWNKVAEQLYGYTAKEAIGQPVADIIRPQISIELRMMRRENLKRDGHWTGEVVHLKKNGVSITALVSNSVTRNAKGEIDGIVTVCRDISKRKELEELLTKSNSELEAFTYSVSHDLRAPLRGIIGFTTILEEDYNDKLDNEGRRITSVIKANTLKMGQLIDDLLTFSRTGRQDMIKTDVDMAIMVKELISEMPQKAQKIEWVIGYLPVVKGDINMIRQVWINLISNAVKYSGTKENQRIEIASSRQGGQSVFFVKDNGVGFDEQYKDKLYKVFQRLHGADEFEGTGVGLALVEKIISKHGGKVWAESEIGKGATFYFSLPEE